MVRLLQRRARARWTPLFVVMWAVSGCAPSVQTLPAAPGAPLAPAASARASAPVSLTVTIPARAVAGARRQPRFVPAGATQIKVTSSLLGSSISLPLSTPPCQLSSGTRVCALQFALPVGAQTIGLTFYDATPNKLAEATTTATISADAPNVLAPVTTLGDVTSATLTATPTTLSIGGTTTLALTAAADAQSDPIAGTFAHVLNLGGGSLSFSQTAFTAVGAPASISATLNSAIPFSTQTITVTPAGGGLAGSVAVTLPGTVATLAGNGTSGFADGTGAAASFGAPGGTAIDGSGNVYVPDYGDHTIRKVTPAGVVTTLAGTHQTSGLLDAAGSAAKFYQPLAVAYDGSNLYVADGANNVIRKVTLAGVVTTFAGGGGTNSAGNVDGAPGVALFNQPSGIVWVSSLSKFFITDFGNNTIRAMDTSGTVTTFAGSPSYGTTDATGTAAQFYHPYGITYGATSGLLYVTDQYNHRIRTVDPSSAVVTTLAGSSQGAVDGAALSAQFWYPASVIVDAAGNVYVGDGKCAVRRIAGGTVSSVSGVLGTCGYVDGVGVAARFNSIVGLSIDANGVIYVSNGTAFRTIR